MPGTIDSGVVSTGAGAGRPGCNQPGGVPLCSGPPDPGGSGSGPPDPGAPGSGPSDPGAPGSGASASRPARSGTGRPAAAAVSVRVGSPDAESPDAGSAGAGSVGHPSSSACSGGTRGRGTSSGDTRGGGDSRGGSGTSAGGDAASGGSAWRGTTGTGSGGDAVSAGCSLFRWLRRFRWLRLVRAGQPAVRPAAGPAPPLGRPRLARGRQGSAPPGLASALPGFPSALPGPASAPPGLLAGFPECWRRGRGSPPPGAVQALALPVGEFIRVAQAGQRVRAPHRRRPRRAARPWPRWPPGSARRKAAGPPWAAPSWPRLIRGRGTPGSSAEQTAAERGGASWFDNPPEPGHCGVGTLSAPQGYQELRRDQGPTTRH